MQGAYYIPCLELPAEKEERYIGVWGQRYLRYIREHKKVFYTNLMTSGKLQSHLAAVFLFCENFCRKCYNKGATISIFIRLISERYKNTSLSERRKSMDNGASSYRRFLDGDDKGIAEIVEDYKDGLILYLNGYINNIFIAEELTEDTFFRLITKKPRYSGKSTFKSWLYAIGRNVAIDYIRHNPKMLHTPIEDMENYLSEEQSLEQSFGLFSLKVFPIKRRQLC